jgi:hypothetical protein
MAMSAQLDLFAPVIEVIVIEPTRDVIHRGAKAKRVPPHSHVPSRRPRLLHTDEEWLSCLRIAERQIRWRRWTQPHPLPLDSRPEECVGGGPGHWYDAKGVGVGEFSSRRYATWPALLRGLEEQRDREPHVADARDLAAAYHALEQYDRFYVRDGGSVIGGGTRLDGDDWRERVAIPHLAKLREIVERLGGDPTLVVPA